MVIGVSGIYDKRYSQMITPLFLIAALLQTTGLFVFLVEYSEGGDPAVGGMLVFGLMLVQICALFAKFKRTVLLFLALFFATALAATFGDWLDITEEFSALVISVAGLSASFFIARTPYHAFVPFTYFVYAITFGFAIFEILEDYPPFDFALIGVSVGLLYVSVVAKSRSLLVASILILLGSLGYFTAEYFADFLSWPIALIVMGFIMLGVSGYAFKLGQSIR